MMAADTLGGLVTAYIGLGANLQDPRRQVQRAIAELAALPDSRLTAVSRLYRTAPVGPLPQPDYVNAAAALATRLAPAALLAALQAVERAHGRVRDGSRWGPRTLDLDILLYDQLQCRLPGLSIPHPQMHLRAFVLVPLADIAPPMLAVPGQGRLGELLLAVSRGGIVPLPDEQAVVSGKQASAELS
jgi:2-amino-4-hydroxy-6-hydroxymethyldihydropteridine diphosphokinase